MDPQLQRPLQDFAYIQQLIMGFPIQYSHATYGTLQLPIVSAGDICSKSPDVYTSGQVNVCLNISCVISSGQVLREYSALIIGSLND